MNKLEFLQNLQTSRAEWDALIAEAQSLGEDAMLARSVRGRRRIQKVGGHGLAFGKEDTCSRCSRN